MIRVKINHFSFNSMLKLQIANCCIACFYIRRLSHLMKWNGRSTLVVFFDRLSRVVSTLVFCILFVSFSYCGEYYFYQLSICDVIVI